MLCEFCDELRHHHNSRFAKIYAPFITNRVVVEYGDFVAMPTIGQLFPGSLLVLPKTHIETMSTLSEKTFQELETFLFDLEEVISQNGPVIIFEHGASCTTGSGCGIYHAHIHLVPVPTSVSVDNLLPTNTDLDLFRVSSSFISGLCKLRDSSEYLIIRDTEHQVRFIESPSSFGKQYPSQYFRKTLADLFGLDRSWDWRTYQGPEQYLLDTINIFRGTNVFICK